MSPDALALWEDGHVFKHQREAAAADGSYRVSAWDDRRGHATIWEYDANDELIRLGVVVHWPQARSAGDVVGEAIWYDTDGREVRRTELRPS
jgi:hypothetical protein